MKGIVALRFFVVGSYHDWWWGHDVLTMEPVSLPVLPAPWLLVPGGLRGVIHKPVTHQAGGMTDNS